MQTTLTFETIHILLGDFGELSSVPAILSNLRKEFTWDLPEHCDFYPGFAPLSNCYPYRAYNSYDLSVKPGEVKTAVLQNEHLRVTFLPEYGGRLWSIEHKQKPDADPFLYTNDMLRPGNLAVRNAWFSGGVEWNMGVIGHTPFTVDPLFTARLTDEQGNHVLRMYEYEQIRNATYQMDFWLEGELLYAHMRIKNESSEMIPMYWWSNMAVPEYPGGRVFVPAHSAYTCKDGKIYTVDIPCVDGVDLTKYNDIPLSVDYFFHVDEETPKYIVNVNKEGYGLMQASTDRLRGRKLFSWGNNPGSKTWQEFLTHRGGNYLEIQAGLDRTQYGCTPMPPNSVYEWVEVYGSIQIDPSWVEQEYRSAEAKVALQVHGIVDFNSLKERLNSPIAKQKGELIQTGSSSGARSNLLRQHLGLPPLSPHLEFGEVTKEDNQWQSLLTQGYFDEVTPTEMPGNFVAGEEWYDIVKDSFEGPNQFNWYAYYQMGLLHYWKHEVEEARLCFLESLALTENCWACHALAVLCCECEEYDTAARYAHMGLSNRYFDLAYVKDCAYVLIKSGAYSAFLHVYDQLPSPVSQDGRILFYKAQALFGTGRAEEAYDLLTKDDGLIVPDVREGEVSVLEVWTNIATALGRQTDDYPKAFLLSPL